MINPTGLSTEQAKIKLAQFGANEIRTNRIHSLFHDLKKILLDPMGLMLLSLAILYWFLGEHTDALIMLGAFIPITAIDVILEIQSSKALRALQASLSPHAKVIRDNKVTVINIREIVPDDILLFEEGQTIPADGIVIESDNLNINESALTGESIPVEKKTGESFLSGTSCLSGRGMGKIQKTGKNSRYGEIAGLIEKIKETKSPLRKTVDRLVMIVMMVAFILALILFFLEYFSSNEFIPSLIAALTLAMAAVPEEFPVVFTLYLSMGAWRLSKMGVLVKTLPSVEALGGVDIICTDKTGTLTEGLFQLNELIDSSNGLASQDEKLWSFALMACEVHAIDAMEVAINKGIPTALNYQSLIENWKLTTDYPFENKGKHMSHVWKQATSGQMRIAMKGAVEGVIEHCVISSEQVGKILKQVENIASKGKRILGLAGKNGHFSGKRDEDERGLDFLGLLVFHDPIRESVRSAIDECQKSGIEVKVLTGDHLLTAHAVADEIGLAHTHHTLCTGSELSGMNQQERIEAYDNGAIFARLMPEQKYEMVKALQAKHKVVAMTGDGINDAPALRLADIGISMGKNATDVARSTANMILLKNDFSGIVHAVLEGRNTFANLRKSFSYLIAFHLPIILLSLIPAFLQWPMILLPVHIILLELVVHPISAFSFENIRTPHPPKNPPGFLLDRYQTMKAIAAGLILTTTSMLIYYLNKESSVEIARTMAFICVLFGNIFLVALEVAPVFNRRFFITCAFILITTLTLTQIKVVANFFHFTTLEIDQLIIAPILSSLLLLPKLTILLSRALRHK